MRRRINHTFFMLVGTLALWITPVDGSTRGILHWDNELELYLQEPDSSLQYPIGEQNGYPYSYSGNESPLYLHNPSNIKSYVEYDPVTGEYVFREEIGNWNYRNPVTMSVEQYRQFEFREAVMDYWRIKASGGSLDNQLSFIPPISLGGEAFDKLFGSNTVNIVPTGSAELVFGYNLSKIDNPNLAERLKSTSSFTFDEKIMMNVAGSIGDKMKMDISYDTEATFDFENQTKLEYAGKEDEIIKKIEAGNVNLPLPGTLINGSMSLFGLKTELQFGKLTVTSVLSQQKGESSVIDVQGGAQLSEFSVSVDDYDVNKHYFLSDYFRENYNKALSRLPVITSDVTITKIEVWVTNKTTNFESSRNIVALTDLGEPDPYSSMFSSSASATNRAPRNGLNNAYELLTTSYSDIRDIKNATETMNAAGLTLGKDFEKIENARMLSSREYTFNEKLGYISLNTALNNDEILAVAYEYTYRGQTYQVGELSSSSGIAAPQTLILKLIKTTNFTPASYTWDLMMKNVYAIGAYQVSEDEFSLDVLYKDDKTGNSINYLPQGSLNKYILLKLMNLDNMNSQQDPYPDGIFDYMEGVTIISSNGRVFFPLLEPFGSDLKKILSDSLSGDEAELAISKYVFQELYDSTKTKAQQIAEKNKFLLGGTYSSSTSSEIMLNAMNIPQGSVKVTAGGRELVEGTDYTVDYTLGRVTIINQGILESGTPIKISLENQSLFDFQTKTLVGTHLDYKISENFIMGATVMHLTERPMTRKVNIGDEPISNTIWGLNGSYSTKSQLLTTLVDKLPFIETKETSNITVVGEFAQLIPGHSRAIDKEGNAYIDDFEASETSIDLRHFASWHLSSTPVGFFSEAEEGNNRAYGYGRAKLAWYQIDPLMVNSYSTTPTNLKENIDLQSNPYVYEVYEQDIFPNKENTNGVPTKISVLNVSYYPKERGPYNYDYENINPDGTLRDPESRWGGMTREIYSSDFEAANVEFIEFWLMDPFVGMETANAGKIYFNLGNVSEDVLKDSRKFFENGMPTNATVSGVDSTVWGRVPLSQSLVNAFSSDEAARKYQDVGLDGLNDEDEYSFFKQEPDDFINRIELLHSSGSLTDEAYNAIINDPSSDNFHYFRGSDYDSYGYDILTRYKNFNSPQGNSPSDLDNIESYSTSGTTLPDLEDINRDNTLSESENFYYYEVDLDPNEMEIGQNYIVDKVETKADYRNGESQAVTWYQFRVPVAEYDGTVGDISDFKSIRFMRMFLTDFADTVLLRFARLELVRGEWRRYNLAFTEGGEDYTGEEPAEGILSISAVNIEENNGKEPVNYVLPPGFTREIDPSQTQLRQLNEQSILLKVEELGDGDARAAYKNVDLDIRQYKRLRMEAHAEAIPGTELEDDELVAFIRIGSDYQSNFYEYEVPLQVTPPGTYDKNSDSDRLIVWPEENKFDIELELFQDVKQARNTAMQDPESEVTLSSIYSIYDGRNKVSVSGNPNMSNIQTIMIGIRNPKAGNSTVLTNDDGMPKSGEIWLNELRLSDFNEKGGWAATGRATAKLADFGNVTVAGATSTPGFGSIEEKVNERSTEQLISYDVSSNFEMGKFFDEKSGVTIPVFTSYSKAISNPEYNPLDPDIPLKKALEAAQTKEEKDSIIRNSRDVVVRKSFAVTNVRVAKPGAKPHFYSLSNWSTSFSVNEMNATNPNLEYYNTQKTRGNLSYNYTARQKNFQPFKSVKWMSSPWLRLIKDFNFNYTPSRLSFRTDFDRYYMEKQTRNISNPDYLITPTFKKDFLWNRNYDVKFDLTKTLKFDFSATNIARIDEPEGRWNKDLDTYEVYRDSLWSSIKSFGRTTSYYHQFTLNYTVPINKIPIFDWISLTSSYTGTYGWAVGPIIEDDPEYGSINLGNSITNSNKLQLNGQMNLVNFYNKVPLLKNINNSRRGPGKSKQEEQRTKTRTFTKENLYLKENSGKYITHNLKTEDVSVKVFDSDGKEVEVSTEIINENRLKITSAETLRNASLTVTGTIKKGENPLTFIFENSVRFLMGVRTVSLTYSYNGGTYLPGYLPETQILGYDYYNGMYTPGFGFIAGWQDASYAYNAFQNGLLTLDQNLNDAFNLNETEKMNYRANIEPFAGFKIDLTGNWNYARNTSEFYTADENGNLPADTARGLVNSGNFSVSFLSYRTAFEKIGQDIDSSKTFNLLKYDYRKIVSDRLAQEYYEKTGKHLRDDDGDGYYDGYGPTSQDVLIPAFVAAYSGRDPNLISTNALMEIWKTMPNWRVSYDGLGRIEALRKFVNSITMSHSYRSTYSIGSFVSNPYYIVDTLGVPIAIDLMGNFTVDQNIYTVTINEQFSPLFDINMDWKNSLTTHFEIKKSRTVALNLSNTQVNEVVNNEVALGAGYRFNEVPLIINQKEFRSDLVLSLDFSLRDSKTMIRKLEDESLSQVTAGQKIITVKAYADYQLSDKFKVRAFYDQRLTVQYVQNGYNNANYSAGFSLTFTL